MGWPKKNGKKYIDVNKHETTTNKKEYIKTHKKKKKTSPNSSKVTTYARNTREKRALQIVKNLGSSLTYFINLGWFGANQNL